MRVVSLVPSLTETVVALGLGPRELVGRTSFCVHPDDVVSRVPRVGGTKTPNVGKIARLAPDLVLLDRDENRAEDARALAAAGLRLFVADVSGPDDVPVLLRALGTMLGRADEAERRAAALEARLAHAAEATGPRVAVLCWHEPMIAVGSSRYGAGLLRALGARPVAFGDEPYPRVSVAQLAAAAPDALVFPTEPHAFTGAESERIVSQVEAAGAPRPRALPVDGEDLFWYGVRTEGAIRRLETIFRP